MWRSILWLPSSKANASAHQGVTGRPLGCLPTDTPFNYNISEAHDRGLTTLTCPLPAKMASMTTEVMGCLPLSHLRSFRCGGQSRPGQDRNLTQGDTTTEGEHVRGTQNSAQSKSVRATVFAVPHSRPAGLRCCIFTVSLGHFWAGKKDVRSAGVEDSSKCERGPAKKQSS